VIYKVEELFLHIKNGMSIKQASDAGGLPITRIETIADAEINLDRVGFAGVNEELAKHFLLKEGEILFSHINSVSHIGKCALYKKEYGLLVHGMNLLSFKPNEKIIYPKFALYSLRSQQFRDQLAKSIKKSVNQASVSIGDIKKITLRIPPLAEQQRIAAILDKAEEIKRKREQAFRVTQSIIESLFAEILSKNISTTKYLSLDECLLKIIDYRGKTPIKTSSGVPLITARVVKNGELLEPTEFIASENYYNWMSRGMPEYGDVLFTTEAPLGEVAILDRTDVALAQRLVLLRPNPSLLNSLFLKYAMTCDIVVSDIHARSTGSTVKGIRQKELRLVKIPIIDIDQQNIFARKVEELLSLKATHKQSLQKSNLLFSSLQNQAFTTGFRA
jgi:type I restriction enzyme S subunit